MTEVKEKSLPLPTPYCLEPKEVAEENASPIRQGLLDLVGDWFDRSALKVMDKNTLCEVYPRLEIRLSSDPQYEDDGTPYFDIQVEETTSKSVGGAHDMGPEYNGNTPLGKSW